MSGAVSGRLFYYSKNAQRVDAFKLLGGNYFVPRTGRSAGVGNIGLLGEERDRPHAFVCVGRTEHGDVIGAKSRLRTAQHMAEQRPIVTALPTDGLLVKQGFR